MLRRRAKAFTGKPWVCRSAPQDACSVHSAQPLPGASASPPRAGGLSFAPASGSPWPSGRQEWGYGSSGPRRLKGWQVGLPWRRDESGAQVPGSGFVACPRWSVPRLGQHSHHPSPQAAVAARDPRSSAEDPLSGASVFVPLTDPLHHAGQRESPRPVPASSQLRSLA